MVNVFYALAHAFLKVGLFGFGGGFAMIPLMQSSAVLENGWVTTQQFASAIALGQVTPGPVAISATFIGYKVAGLPGAVIATVAVFAPSILIMYLLEKFYLKVRGKEVTQAIMHGVLPVVAAIILHAAITLGRPNLSAGWPAVVALIVATLAITRSAGYGLLIALSTAAGVIASFV